MPTEAFHESRLILTMRDGTAVWRDDIAELLAALPTVSLDEAEHVVAVSGEDERAYAPRPHAAFLAVLFQTADDFLADTEGGWRDMLVHVTRHPRCRAAIEFWFQVRTPGAGPGSAWIRHLAIGLDGDHIFAGLG